MDKRLTRAAAWPGCVRAMTTLARLARLCVADYAWQRPAMNGEQGVVHGARLAQQRLPSVLGAERMEPCFVCGDALSVMQLRPCQHLCACEQHGVALARAKQPCPACTAPVVAVAKLTFG